MSDDPDSLAARVSAEMLAKEGTGPAWGLVIEESRANYARVRMTVTSAMLNGHGTAHGGMIFALADSAFAYACNSHNSGTVSQQASIAYLSAPKAGEVLVAEAQQGPRVGRSAVTHVRVTCEEDGRLIAEFTGLGREIGGEIVPPLEDTHD